MDNERLKILLDTLVKLTESWSQSKPGAMCGMIATQIDFVKRLIREEIKGKK